MCIAPDVRPLSERPASNTRLAKDGQCSIEGRATSTYNCKGEGAATNRSAAINAEAPHPSLSPLPRGEGDQPQWFAAWHAVERFNRDPIEGSGIQ